MSERPNVLLVVLGSGRPDHLSCAGYERPTTPFIDQLAGEGVRFVNAISTACSALPAHASILTGLFPATHGATEESGALGAPHRLLSEHLEAAGYRTAAFCTDPWISPEAGFGRGFDRFHTQRVAGRFAGRAANLARKASDRVLGRADRGARRTNRALLDWAASGNDPFFAYVSYRETEPPLTPPAPYDRTFLVPELKGVRLGALQQEREVHLAAAVSLSAEDVAVANALYDGALRYVDMRIKELVDGLAARGKWEETLLVLTADHGLDLGEHGRLGSGFDLCDTALRVPLIFRCPNRVPSGFVVEEMAQPTDISPTVLAIAGLDAPEAKVQGRVLLAGGRAGPAREFAIAEQYRRNLDDLRRRFAACDTRPLDVRMKAIRTRRAKFVWHSDEANELYDLARDPAEQSNLAESAPAPAADLRRSLFDWLSSVEQEEPAAENAASLGRFGSPE